MGYPIRKKLNLLKNARKELLKRDKQGIDVEYLLKDVDKKIIYYNDLRKGVSYEKACH